MSKIDREFLVPYLRDVCALYMAERKLNEKIATITNEINERSPEYYVEAPEEPKKESLGCLPWGFCIFMIGVPVLALVNDAVPAGVDVLMGIGIIIGVIALIKSIIEALEVSEQNEARRKNYELDLIEYKKEVDRVDKLNKNNKALIPSLKVEKRLYTDELKKVKELREKIYNVNIIPTHYRNIYAAYYLYDFFSKGISDDLDMALNTFVLEQIKEKLDIVIQQQTDIILNQRIAMINQQRALDEQNKHNDYLRKKINRIAKNSEDTNHYLAMIESNTEATAYFAAAKYFKD